MGRLSQEWVRFRERVTEPSKARGKPIPDEEIFWAGMAHMYALLIYDTSQGLGLLQEVSREIEGHYERVEAQAYVRVIKVKRKP